MTAEATVGEPRITLNSTTIIEDVPRLVSGYNSVTINCGVMEIEGPQLNEMMKRARGVGVTYFKLINVCGQTLIGTGIPGPVKIDVHGLMGNHSAAFVDSATINTYSTTFPNGVWAPGDAQVAIGNTANPSEINIGGSVDDLFASYCPSGTFRVAGQGGNRCVLRGGAGVPQAWREIDYSSYDALSNGERKEEMLYLYQQRRATLMSFGWQAFLNEYKKKVEDRDPPVIVFGRRVRDYFMEYAQGTVGIVLNVFDVPQPAGYYICSGMTAGRAYIRGEISAERLGERVKFTDLSAEDFPFLVEQIKTFYDTFNGRMDEEYQSHLDKLRDDLEKDSDSVIERFKKIIPQ